MITSPLFPSGQTSATTENSGMRSGSEHEATIWVLEVTDAGSWSGTIKVAARSFGAAKDGSAAFTDHISVKNRDSEQVIDGDIGITAAGVYEVNIGGMEVRLEHTRTAGTVRVRDHMVAGYSPMIPVDQTSMAPDSAQSRLVYRSVTLSGTPDQQRRVAVPNWARGFKLYPVGNNCQFAINEEPAAISVVAAGVTDVTEAHQVGGIAKSNLWEARILAAGTTRWLHLKSATASLVVDVEFFA